MQRRYFHVRVVFHAAFFPFLSGATVRTPVVICRNSLPETIHQRHHRRVNAKQFIRFVDLENSFFRYCRLIEFNLRELLYAFCHFHLIKRCDPILVPKNVCVCACYVVFMFFVF